MDKEVDSKCDFCIWSQLFKLSYALIKFSVQPLAEIIKYYLGAQ